MVDDLENKIKKSLSEGALPFVVCGTAGTTVLGAFDPFHDIADVCRRYGLWFHVDVRRNTRSLLFVCFWSECSIMWQVSLTSLDNNFNHRTNNLVYY